MNNILIYIKTKKGQSDTVFEVLIAVILLGFVLVAATLAMSSLSNTKCSKSIDISLGDLKMALETASSSSLISTDFLFDLPYCFGSSPLVTLSKAADAKICSVYCPGSNGKCYLLKYDNQKDKVNPVRYLCVNISPVVETNGDVCNGVETDYTVVPANNKNGYDLNNARYRFSSSSLSTTNNAPSLCIYSKSRVS